jgi:hypothetical protein
MDKRRFIDLLPENIRTDVLSKFFVATVDQVFQPGSVETLSGYIGQKPSYFDATTDFYITEPTDLRTAHQLEPGLVTRGSDGTIDRLLTADDFVSYLAANNALTNDQNRLFSDQFYAWSPPVDLDKLNNPTFYRWFGDAPNAMPTLVLTAPYAEVAADGASATFALPPALTGLSASQEQPIVFTDGAQASFVRDGDSITLTTIPAKDTVVRVYRYGSLQTALTGLKAFDPSVFGAPVTALTSGMRVRLEDGVSFGSGWDILPFQSIFLKSGAIVDIPWDEDDQPTSYFVEGVGSSIVLVAFDLNPPIVEKGPIYVVNDRASGDLSPWSRINYWVHVDAVSWSGNDFPGRRGNRPIIEFTRDLELYNYGTTRKPDIDGTISGLLLKLPLPVPNYVVGTPISNWDLDPWEITAWDASGLEHIELATSNGQLPATLYVDGGHPLLFGDRILVLSNDNSDLNHRIFTVTPTTTDVTGTEETVMAIIVEDMPEVGDIVRQPQRGAVPFEQDGFDIDPFEYDFSPIEYWYNGTEWLVAQARQLTDSDPLFELYTADAVRLETVETFTGSKLFSFAAGTGASDSVLNRPLSYNANGEIIFEDTVNVVDGACRFMRTYTGGAFALSNGWRANPALSHQSITGGIFSTPVNLASNPDNLYVTSIAKSQWFQQLTGTMSAQTGFTGSAFAKNNYRDTARDLSLGTTIVQSRSPLLKAMLLASDSRFDYFDAVRYVDGEYARFRTKFVAQVLSVQRSGQCTDADSPDTWVVTILNNLKLAKTVDFPFALSDVAGGRYFVPPTAAWLGLIPPMQPRIEIDDTFSPPVTMLRGHDGSRTPAFGDLRDTILLALETRIYNSILAAFKTEAMPPFDFFDVIDGRDRPAADTSATGVDACGQALPTPPAGGVSIVDTGATTAQGVRYGAADIVSIYTPLFLRWAQINGLSFTENNGYIADDPFTYNYRDLPDRDGRAMPGGWRAIYRWFFDTDHPHTAPWEMLGFADMPAWWEDEYGAAPYTNGNLHLWQDLRDGVIRGGVRAGVDARFKRPDLLSYIPVDESGALLDPVAARLVTQAPTEPQAKRDWIVGDLGPVEALWFNSVSYPFARAIIAALTRPALWTEFGFDRSDLLVAQNGYWLSATTMARPHAADMQVHGEINPDGTRVVKVGFQQWIVDMMASNSIAASVLGDACRSMGVQLLHKMAGFTTTSGMSVFADNLGLLPIEDVEVVYHTSPPVREVVYSGVIVEWNGAGWRVVGYDPGSQSFCTMPGEATGPQQVISLGNDVVVYEWGPNIYYPLNRAVIYQNQTYLCTTAHTSSKTFEAEFWNLDPSLTPKVSPRVSLSLKGDGTIVSVPYGTVFDTYQDVATFLNDYARYLEAAGFVFNGIDPATGNAQNWEQAIRDYLSWAQVSWPVGTGIALSPGASTLQFVAEQGYVLNLEESANGIFGLTNRTGRRILAKNTFITREDDTTTILTLTNDLWAARVRVAEIEHVLAFKNTTLFNDLIYDPLLALRQPRLRINGARSIDWAGRRDAPGYMIIDNALVPSFDKAASDMRTMFEIERSDRQDFRDFTRQMLGFQPRSYLTNLLVSETQQLEFYQGMIQAKGSVDAFSRLARSTFIEGDDSLQFLDEWGILLSRFGAVNTRQQVAFTLTEADIRSNPQLVTFGTDNPNDAIVGVTDDSDRWIAKPANPELIFNGRAEVSSPILPDAGYARVTEVNMTAFSFDYLTTLFVNMPYNFDVGTKIWLYDRDIGGFDVIQAFSAGAATNAIGQIIGLDLDPTLGNKTRIVMTGAHGFTPDDVGMFVCITGTTLTDPQMTGFYRIDSIDSARSFVVLGDTTTSYDYVQNGVQAPVLLAFRSIRFATRDAAALFAGRFPPAAGQYAYVDDTGNGTWAVYTFNGTAWTVARQQPRKIDSTRLSTVRIYNQPTAISTTSIQAEPLLLDRVLVLDPILGMIPGDAEREITYRQQWDPAQYFGDNNAKWGPKQVGQLWWDLSTVRYLQAETDIIDSADPVRMQAEMDYRVRYWGSLAPGSIITVYEWTRSYEEPLDTGLILKKPSNGSTPYYNITTEYDEATGTTVSVYYFWSLNPQYVPNVPGRSISAYDVAVLLTSQALNGLPWVAPIAPNAMLVGNCEPYFTSADSVLSFEVIDPTYEGEVHTEWQLVSPDSDLADLPDAAWDKLRDSLTGFDHNGVATPSPSTPSSLAVGVGAGQTMFSDGRDGMLRARRTFVTKLNQILARTNAVVNRLDVVAALNTEADTWAQLMWSKVQGAAEDARPPVGSYKDVAHDLAGQAMAISDLSWALSSRAKPMDLTAWEAYPFDVDLSGDKRLYTQGPRVVLANYYGSTPSWSVWEIDPDSQAVIPQNLRIAENFDVTVATRADRDAMAAAGNLVQWQRVLVQSDENVGGLWTSWLYTADTGINGPFVFETAQPYRLSDFVSQVDWYADGYDVLSPPTVTYATVAARTAAEMPNPTNTFVMVSNDGTGRWIWTAYDGSQWNVVAQQRGTLALSSAFYDATRAVYTPTAAGLANATNRDGSSELRAIINAMKETLTTTEVKELFFAMLHFIHVQQDAVDWAFKTSFISIVRIDQHLTASPIAVYDNTQNLLDYLEEVKPYRGKIRAYNQVLNPTIDVANVQTSDFDKPLYYDTSLSMYRRLDPSNAADAAIIVSQEPWKDWYAAQAIDPANNPVRKLAMTLRFDRIDPGTEPLEPGYGWDIVPWDTSAWDDEAAVVNLAGSALTRMLAYYAPTEGMRAKDATTLFDLAYKGTHIEGGTMLPQAVMDTPIQGTDAANAAVLINPDGTPGVSSFAAPYYAANRPQELTAVSTNDVLQIRVTTAFIGGQPARAALYLDLSGNTQSTVSVDLPITPADANAISIFVDGLFVDPATTTVDYVNARVSVPVATTAKILYLLVIGVGSTTTILEDDLYTTYPAGGFSLSTVPVAGQPATPTTARPFFPYGSAAEVDVVIDGVVLTSGVTVSGQTVQVAPEPSSTSLTQVVLRQTTADTSAPSMHTHRQTFTADATGALTATLTNPPVPTWGPEHVGTMVYAGGSELQPPFTRFGVLTATNSVLPFTAVSQLNLLSLYLQKQVFAGTVYATTRDLLPVPSTELTIPAIDRATIDAGLNFEVTAFDTWPFDVESAFLICEDRIVAAPGVLGPVMASTTEMSQYQLDGANLTVSAGGAAGREIVVDTIDHVSALAAEVNVFFGSPYGLYPITSAVPSIDFLCVSLNGSMLTPAKQFGVQRRTLGFEEEVFEFSGFGGDNGDQTIITMPGVQKATDCIVVHANTAPVLDEEHFDVAATTGPSATRMGSQVYNNGLPLSVTTIRGDRGVFKLDGSYEMSSADPNEEYPILDDLTADATQIRIDVTERGDLAVPFAPSLDPSNPSALWIGPERIEYFAVDVEGTVATLSALRRGTRGTPVGVEQRVQASYPGDGVSFTFDLPGGKPDQAVEAVIRTAAGLVQPIFPVSYVEAASGDGVTVTLRNPVAPGSTLQLAQSFGVYHPMGSAAEPIQDVGISSKVFITALKPGSF